MTNLTGQVVGSYELHALIGEGGMSHVYCGLDHATGRTVALKALKSTSMTAQTNHLERFQREGELLRELNHPNIVQVLDVIQTDAQPWIVMEYVSDGSLRDLLDQQSQLPLERVLWIALDLADALTRAHRLDIIHRDLKPENVLMADDGTPRLTDFGIAQLVTQPRLTGEGHLVGTPHYLSPEAINGRHVDTRADIWSFGVLLFEMLAGQVPFEGQLLTQILHAIVYDPLPDLETLRPNTPIALVDLVYRMLEKDSAARIPSVRLVGAELEALLRGENMVERVLGADVDRHTIDGSSVFAVPTPTADGPQHNLPVQTTPFVGRKAELRELARLIADDHTRLITILGPGGMGKTRLALEAAAHQLDNFERGVWFVALAPLSDPASIVTAIAEAVGFQFYQGGTQQEQLLNYLRTKEMLLVLDNFEHLLEGADVVQTILSNAPEVMVLATSRAKLNLGAETILAIGGIAFPGWETPEDALDYSAVKLFMQSAKRVAPEFELGTDHLQFVARICRLVEGMPLGILLAAAWADMLTPQEIADEITHSLDFLASERRDLPERHRSMRAVFESAWERLDAAERDAMMRLAVFRGGFTRQAAQHVTGVSLRGLMALVNKSLVQRKPDTGRYEIHELLRQFAEERLYVSSESDAVRDAHSAYYLKAVADREADLKGAREVEALDAIESDFENVQTAWFWALEHENFTTIAGAMAGLSWAYLRLIRSEAGKTAFEAGVRALETDMPEGENGILLGVMLRHNATFASHSDEAHALAERSLAILRRFEAGVELAWALQELGNSARYSGDFETASQLYGESLTIFTAHSDWFGQATACRRLSATLRAINSDIKAAEAHLQQALAIDQAREYRLGVAYDLLNLANVAYISRDHQKSEQLHLEALALFRAIDFRVGIGTTLNSMAMLALLTGDHARSKSLMEEAIALANEQGHFAPALRSNMSLILGAVGDQAGSRRYLQALLAWLSKHGIHFQMALQSIFVYAMLLARENYPERATELVALAWSKRGASNDELKPLVESVRDDLQATLPPDMFAAAWERGTVLDLEETVQVLLDELSPPITTSEHDPIATPPTVDHSPDALSERELEVLCLMAEGLTNRQIAERLYISRGTVKAHAHNIYDKLDVNNRTEAAVRARQLGLLD